MLFINKKPKGIIGYLKLDDFWKSCNVSEQNSIIEYYKKGINNYGSPIEGSITSSSDRRINYLTSVLECAVKDKKYDLADKIIQYGKKDVDVNSATPLDIHFFLQTAAECYYKQRDQRNDAIQLCIDFCNQDVSFIPTYIPIMKKEYGTIPRIVTVQRLVIIYEKNNQIDKAIEICELAIRFGLTDSAKSGYIGRLEKLKKKLY